MALYIKANHLVAKALKLEDERIETKDGCYILWQADMLRFGSLVQLSENLERIGAIALSPTEAREEQDGIKLRKLPLATEEQYQYDNPYPYEPEQPQVPEDDTEDDTEEELPEDFVAEPLPDMSESSAVVIEDTAAVEPTEDATIKEIEIVDEVVEPANTDEV